MEWHLLTIAIAILLVASAAVAPGLWQDLWWWHIRTWQQWGLYIIIVTATLLLLVCLVGFAFHGARPDLLMPAGSMPIQ